MASKNIHNHNQKSQKASELERFRLNFEYDVTWRDVKKSVRERAQTK